VQQRLDRRLIANAPFLSQLPCPLDVRHGQPDRYTPGRNSPAPAMLDQKVRDQILIPIPSSASERNSGIIFAIRGGSRASPHYLCALGALTFRDIPRRVPQRLSASAVKTTSPRPTAPLDRLTPHPAR
jgi:hypothetical protein